MTSTMRPRPLEDLPSVEALIDMPKDQFEKWYQPRLEATRSLLLQFELVGSVPCSSDLAVGGPMRTCRDYHAVGSVMDALNDAMRSLAELKAIREHKR